MTSLVRTSLSPIHSVPRDRSPRRRTLRRDGDLDRMLSQSGDGAFVIDADGRILVWNHAAEKLLGHGAGDVLGRLCCEVFAGRDQHENRICYPACRARTLIRDGGIVHPYDVQTTTKAGTPIWLNVSVLSIPPVTVHLFRDVTAQRTLLRILQEKLASVAAAPPTPSEPRPGATPACPRASSKC